MPDFVTARVPKYFRLFLLCSAHYARFVLRCAWAGAWTRHDPPPRVGLPLPVTAVLQLQATAGARWLCVEAPRWQWACDVHGHSVRGHAADLGRARAPAARLEPPAIARRVIALGVRAQAARRRRGRPQ